MHLAVAVVAAALLAQGSPPPSRVGSTGHVSLSYTLRAFGIPFGRIDFAAVFEPAHHRSEMHFSTSGLAAALWKANIDASAEGAVAADGSLLPGVYTSQSVSRGGERRSVRVTYGGKGGPVMIAVPPYDLSHFAVSDAQKRGAADPLTSISSLVHGLNSPSGERCGRPLAVYDGRRRYDVVFSLVKEEPDAPLPDGSGSARVCRADYREIAGIRQEVVDVIHVPAIYAEFIDVAAGGQHYTIARRLWSSFLWGAVSAQATEVRIDGRPLTVAP